MQVGCNKIRTPHFISSWETTGSPSSLSRSTNVTLICSSRLIVFIVSQEIYFGSQNAKIELSDVEINSTYLKMGLSFCRVCKFGANRAF